MLALMYSFSVCKRRARLIGSEDRARTNCGNLATNYTDLTASLCFQTKTTVSSVAGPTVSSVCSVAGPAAWHSAAVDGPASLEPQANR
jgi:hypothetical protein